MRALLFATTALFLVAGQDAQAQSNVEGRVGKLESEMRAVQRKVFPDGQYLQPAVEAQPDQGPVAGAPSASALTDLTSRVSSLEGQLASLTGQVEQAGYRTRQVQEQFDTYRRATDARLSLLEGAAAPVAVEEAPVAVGSRPATRPTTVPPRPTATPTPTTLKSADDAPAAGIAKPSTGDGAEDAYLYGFRLWSAKRYPEAQAALKKATADYPRARRYSYAQNLLGRAYLDEGNPATAAETFYANYQKNPRGERAPDSLYYLAQALVKLGKAADACKVYGELTDVYGAKISTSMKADVAKGRTAAKCQ